MPGYYAIGDVVPGPALAHVASAEGIVCVEKIAGHHPEPIDYGNIPGCTYCSPEIASVGMTEKAAGLLENGIIIAIMLLLAFLSDFLTKPFNKIIFFPLT